MSLVGWQTEPMKAADRWVIEPRDGVVVSGHGARTYLHSQLSQSVADLAVGESRWTLVLRPDGHVEVVARVWCRTDEDFVLDVEQGFGDALEARIRRFMIRVAAEVSRIELVATMAVDAAVDSAQASDDGTVVGWWGSGTVLLREGGAADGASGDGERLAGARVAAGWPAMGAEVVPGERVPVEIGLVPVAVDLGKGCYPGQELVERMDSRGAKAPRRLCQLDVLPGAEPGDPIVVEGAEVGELTTVAGNLALGYVKRGVDHGRPVATLPAASPIS